MKFTDSGETFTKYSECYNKKLDKKFASDTNEKVKESYADFKSDGLKYFQSLEKQYKCMGICEPTLFFVETSVAEGPPTIDCVSAMTSEENWKNFYGVGAVAFITAIILIVAGIAAFPLTKGWTNRNTCGGCCKEAEDDEMGQQHA